MAILEKEIRDGIQLGNALDYCWKCYKPGSTVEYGKLEYKDVFKLHLNGLEHCLCMKHFNELLKGYTLIHGEELTEENTLTIPKNLAENGTYDEVLEYIEKAIKK